MATWGTGLSLRGAPGADGLRGAQFYETSGAPTDATASSHAGDVAVDTSDANYPLYQRGADGWPAQGINLRGPMGFAGVNSGFGTGDNPPDDSLFKGQNGVYLQTTGELWVRSVGQAWVDTGENFRGPRGQAGADGLRGTQTYTGTGAPQSDLSKFIPPAVAGDLYYDIDPNNAQRPVLYVLS